MLISFDQLVYRKKTWCLWQEKSIDFSCLLWLAPDRQHRVYVECKTSDSQHVTCGISLGSIRGPLLFIEVMNDIHLVTNNATTDMYGDDSTTQTKAKTIDEVEFKLNSDLVNVSQWCNENEMVINIDKTFAMLIATYQKVWRLHKQHLDLTLNSSLLQPVTSQKLLGINVDQYLNWKITCRWHDHGTLLNITSEV